MSQQSTFFSLLFYDFGNFQTKGSFIDTFGQLKEGLDVTHNTTLHPWKPLEWI